MKLLTLLLVLFSSSASATTLGVYNFENNLTDTAGTRHGTLQGSNLTYQTTGAWKNTYAAGGGAGQVSVPTSNINAAGTLQFSIRTPNSLTNSLTVWSVASSAGSRAIEIYYFSGSFYAYGNGVNGTNTAFLAVSANTNYIIKDTWDGTNRNIWAGSWTTPGTVTLTNVFSSTHTSVASPTAARLLGSTLSNYYNGFIDWAIFTDTYDNSSTVLDYGATPTPTATPTGTQTHTPTLTKTPTLTATTTLTASPTLTNSPTLSFTSTDTKTATATGTPTRTATRTPSPTPTITRTPICSLIGQVTPVVSSYYGFPMLSGNKYTFPTSVYVNRFSMYLQSAGSTIQMGLYSNLSGRAHTRVLQSYTATAQVGWNNLTCPGTWISAGDYWLVLQASDLDARVWGGPVADMFIQRSPTASGAMPSTVTGILYRNKYRFSAYMDTCY